ncbi:MAG: DUF2807 domain-containing protein [Bacteroidales bacterium]|nr:DUF2807 domain-containing protein [Lentimicrobiaceae bacterium]MDD5694031.1 DUF2807 domain-containing protein [Bacteroidales bacterium]
MKIKAFFLLLLTTCIGYFYTGCDGLGRCIDGNETVETETRNVGSFSRISSESYFDVFIIRDSVEQITVEAESNLLPYIQTVVDGSTLIIREQRHHCLDNNLPIKVTVRVKVLEKVHLAGSGYIQGNSEFIASTFSVDLSGSGNIDLEVRAERVEVDLSGSGDIDLGAVTPQIDATISGSGDINLWGESGDSALEISGSGSIKAYGLIQDNCWVKISGSGNIFVFVNDYLDVTISGSGSVYYKGNPQIEVSISGSGEVIHG